MIKTLAALRRSFWADHPKYARHYRAGKRQNAYPTDVRVDWVYYVDGLEKAGQITRKLAESAIL